MQQYSCPGIQVSPSLEDITAPSPLFALQASLTIVMVDLYMSAISFDDAMESNDVK